MIENELPEGWASSTLQSLTEYVIGGDWGKDPSENNTESDHVEVACIRGSEIKNWLKDKGATASIRSIKLSSLQNRELRSGDILVEISGGGPTQPVGRTVIIDDDVFLHNEGIPKVCSNFMRLLRLVDNIDKNYVQKFLEFFYFSGEVIKYQGGSNNLRNLKFKEYSGISIPLPPLAEQERIVAKLDMAFGYLETMKASLERIPELLKTFRQSVLTQAVTGKLTEDWRENRADGKEWIPTKLAEIADSLSGYAFESKDFTTSGIQLVRMGNLYNNKLDLGRNPVYLPNDYDPKIVDRYTVRNNDILLSLTGTKYKRDYGFAIKVSGNENLLLNQRILALRAKHEKVYSDFLLFVLQEENFRNQFFSFETGGVNQGNVGVRGVLSISILVPSLAEQAEIVNQLQALLFQTDAIEAQYLSLKQKIDKLPQALLAKAFRGELVPQDPADEPASLLLRKIKAQNEKPALKTKKLVVQKHIDHQEMRDNQTFIELLESKFNDAPFSFDEIRPLTNKSYEELKEEIFGLLDSKKGLTTMFNEGDRRMKFKIISNETQKN